MSKIFTKNIRKNQFNGDGSVPELIYDRYSGMLFSYILQFVPDRDKAGALLVEIFSRLAPRLTESPDSSLGVYCWLQVESRKIILEHGGGGSDCEYSIPPSVGSQYSPTYYFSLLAEAPPEHQWVFRELFLHGCKKEELALQSGKDPAYISRILRECLLTIRKNLR